MVRQIDDHCVRRRCRLRIDTFLSSSRSWIFSMMKRTKSCAMSSKGCASWTMSFVIPVNSAMNDGMGVGGFTREKNWPSVNGLPSESSISHAISMTWCRSLEKPVVSKSKTMYTDLCYHIERFLGREGVVHSLLSTIGNCSRSTESGAVSNSLVGTFSNGDRTSSGAILTLFLISWMTIGDIKSLKTYG